MINVVVSTDVGSKIYPVNSILKINAEKDMNISFFNITVLIKKGENVTVKCMAEDSMPMLYILGENFKNIDVNGNKFSSENYSIIKFDAETGRVEVLKGDVEITDSKGNTAFLKKNQNYKVEIYESPILNVTEQEQKKNNYIQEERDILSPSAPR